MDWINLAQDRDKRQAVGHTVTNSYVAKELLASQAGLHSMQFVSQLVSYTMFIAQRTTTSHTHTHISDKSRPKLRTADLSSGTFQTAGSFQCTLELTVAIAHRCHSSQLPQLTVAAAHICHSSQLP